MDPHRVFIATPLAEDLVERLRGVDGRLEIVHEPELLPPPRYPSDHRGDDAFRRTPEQERRFEELVAAAEVLFGIPGDTPEGLAWAFAVSPRLRFVQATAAGAGEQVRASGVAPDELARVAVATSSGVHAGPLAEWALFGLLAFKKELPRLLDDKARGRWPGHYAVPELAGSTLLVAGVGAIGAEVARLASAFGMRVLGVKRHPDDPVPHVESMHGPEELPRLAREADAIVVTLPLTDETRGLVDRKTIESLREGAVFVNIGRGAVVDEDALVDALRSGRLAGAALDVVSQEPLPPSSPLWALDNVILSPHTAALSVRENARIVDLFADNLRRFLAGEPIRNRVRPSVFY